MNMLRRFLSKLNPKAMLFGFLLSIFLGIYMGMFFVDEGAFIVETFETTFSQTIETPGSQFASGQPDINVFLTYMIPVLIGVYVLGYVFGRFGRRI